MHGNPLTTYLTDHLAGAVSACKLTSRLLDADLDRGLIDTLSQVKESIGRHQEVIREVLRLRGDKDQPGKSLTGRLAGRLARPALRHVATDEFDLLRALEILILGMHGRVALWQAMEAVVPSHPELQHLQADALRAEAQQDVDRMDRWRIEVAQRVLRGWVQGGVAMESLMSESVQ